MSFLRHVRILGVQRRNEDARDELDIFSISDQIEDRKQELLEHFYRMDHQRLVKLAIDHKPPGISADRLRRRW